MHASASLLPAIDPLATIFTEARLGRALLHHATPLRLPLPAITSHRHRVLEIGDVDPIVGRPLLACGRTHSPRARFSTPGVGWQGPDTARATWPSAICASAGRAKRWSTWDALRSSWEAGGVRAGVRGDPVAPRACGGPCITGCASWCVRVSFVRGSESSPCGHNTAEPFLGATETLMYGK